MEFAKAYPEFRHIMMFFHDWKTNDQMVQQVQESGMECSTGAKLTKQLMEDVDPVLLVMHNTPGKLIEGKWPFEWLQKWRTMTIHHMKSSPLVPVDQDVFVSKEVYNRGFQSTRPKNLTFCPPCIDARPYAELQRTPDNKRLVIGRLQTDSPRRHPPEIMDMFKTMHDKFPEAKFTIVGGAKYYKDTKGVDIWMPPVGHRQPHSLYASFDILLVCNPPEVTDTWSRVVTEGMAAGLPVIAENRGGPAEQIDHGENGFLCGNYEEFMMALEVLAKSPKLRYDMGMKARKKACKEFGLERLRRDTESLLLKSVLEVA